MREHESEHRTDHLHGRRSCCASWHDSQRNLRLARTRQVAPIDRPGTKARFPARRIATVGSACVAVRRKRTVNLKVRPYKRGGWEVDIVLKLPSGEQWRERVRSPADSRAASKRWGEERASYVLANWEEVTRPKKEPAPTLAAFEQRFLSEYAEANRQKPSTIEAKKSILRNHLVPALGKLKLDEIGTAQVQKLKGRLSKRKPKTVNNVLNTLSVILRIAVKWGVIERMPCHIELIKASASEMEFYDFEEHKRLVEAAAELNDRIHLLVLLGCDAGLRCGEIVALEWSDVDFKRNAITVSRSEW